MFVRSNRLLDGALPPQTAANYALVAFPRSTGGYDAYFPKKVARAKTASINTSLSCSNFSVSRTVIASLYAAAYYAITIIAAIYVLIS